MRQRVASDETASIHDADARAERLHLFHVMAGVDDGHAGGVEPADLLEEWLRDCGSTPAVGSSSNNQRRADARAPTPRLRRRFMPPENVLTRWSARSAKPMAARISSTRRRNSAPRMP